MTNKQSPQSNRSPPTRNEMSEPTKPSRNCIAEDGSESLVDKKGLASTKSGMPYRRTNVCGKNKNLDEGFAGGTYTDGNGCRRSRRKPQPAAHRSTFRASDSGSCSRFSTGCHDVGDINRERHQEDGKEVLSRQCNMENKMAPGHSGSHVSGEKRGRSTLSTTATDKAKKQGEKLYTWHCVVYCLVSLHTYDYYWHYKVMSYITHCYSCNIQCTHTSVTPGDRKGTRRGGITKTLSVVKRKHSNLWDHGEAEEVITQEGTKCVCLKKNHGRIGIGKSQVQDSTTSCKSKLCLYG